VAIVVDQQERALGFHAIAFMGRKRRLLRPIHQTTIDSAPNGLSPNIYVTG
jgi:hypothetical protein